MKEKIKELENYLSDLDNLVDCGFLDIDKPIKDYVFHYKETPSLKDFILEGREIIRNRLMLLKDAEFIKRDHS